MAHTFHALSHFIVDTSAMSPRYNPGDELFLRPFFGVTGTDSDKPDIAIATDDGRIHVGQFLKHDATGVSILLLFQNKTAFIAHNRQPILYAIAGVKRQKSRPGVNHLNTKERLFVIDYDIKNAFLR